MSGYLQRLLDVAAPAAEPPGLTPVIRSTSPIFEQNQLLGLAGVQADVAAEGPPEAAAAPQLPLPGRPGPLPPAATPDLPMRETMRQQVPPMMPAWPAEAAPARPTGEDPPPPRPMAASAAPARREEPAAPRLDPVQRDADVAGPAPGRVPALVAVPERPEHVPVAREVAREVVRAPVEIERVVTAAAPSADGAAPDQPPRAAGPAELPIVTGDVVPDIEPSERLPDEPIPPGMLEPRARRDGHAEDAGPRETVPEPPAAPPRITIGRLTVEVVPERAAAPKPARAPRTAATASVIGPLGNARARRRLFALARL